jgi:hypothetical protein
MPDSKKKYLQTYISRVNRVIDYIEENIDKGLYFIWRLHQEIKHHIADIGSGVAGYD